MSEDIKAALARRKLACTDNGDLPIDVKSIYCSVSHSELDTLIGRYMQMCDLIGDQEQRKALKDTIKRIGRDWLDDLYEESGYDKYTGITDRAQKLLED